MSQEKEKSALAKFATPLIILATIIWGSSFVVIEEQCGRAAHLLAAGHPVQRFRHRAGHRVLPTVEGVRQALPHRRHRHGLPACLWPTPSRPSAWRAPPRAKNAFFTAVYCVIVPFLYWAIARRRPDRFNVLAAFLCIGGIALVSITGDNASAFNFGDVLTLIGGFFFACHIVAVAKFSEGRDIFILTALQFASFAVFSWIGVAVTRTPVSPEVFDQSLIFGLAYLVIFASCGALLFQNIGQKYTAPATAAVLLSLEGPLRRGLLHPAGRRAAHSPHVPGLCPHFPGCGVLRDQVFLPPQKRG